MKGASSLLSRLSVLACALFLGLSSGGLFLVAENAGQLVQFRPRARNEDYSVYHRFIPHILQKYICIMMPQPTVVAVSHHIYQLPFRKGAIALLNRCRPKSIACLWLSPAIISSYQQSIMWGNKAIAIPALFKILSQ